MSRRLVKDRGGDVKKEKTWQVRLQRDGGRFYAQSEVPEDHANLVIFLLRILRRAHETG